MILSSSGSIFLLDDSSSKIWRDKRDGLISLFDNWSCHTRWWLDCLGPPEHDTETACEKTQGAIEIDHAQKRNRLRRVLKDPFLDEID